MATTKKSATKKYSCAEIIKLSRSPSDADQVTVTRALKKRLTKKEALVFRHLVLRVRSPEFVCDLVGVTPKEVEALAASAATKLG